LSLVEERALKALLCSARAKEQKRERERERASERDPERAEWSLLLTVVAKDFDQPK
jgi:hypothetical protein